MACGPPSTVPAAAQDTNDEQPVQSNSRSKKGRNVCFLCANPQGLQGNASCRLAYATYLLHKKTAGQTLPTSSANNRLCAICFPE
eukprot:5329622-Pleurochrysis_carterae.AAC.2